MAKAKKLQPSAKAKSNPVVYPIIENGRTIGRFCIGSDKLKERTVAPKIGKLIPPATKKQLAEIWDRTNGKTDLIVEVEAKEEVVIEG